MDKSLVEKPKHFVQEPEEEVGPRKGKQPCGSSSSLQKQKFCSTSAKKGQASPKEKSERQSKGKGKIQVEQALPQNYRILKKEKTAMENVFNMERTHMEFKNKEE
ncbi:hypothetical protein O181_104772 [Austropuccinia psidii MF-1]|uniref:Uncharacterized protein n=1 Tax=Austropuccinia psidii MF-1 TaxID=1389203 RepID=A0A9Q3PLS5_9BASI|nr:hypothetical protein [Austropuccinia psidii MF-1]